MFIHDVIGEIRETQLAQALKIASLEGNVRVLERFTWNMLKALQKADPLVAAAAIQEASRHGELPIYLATLVDSAVSSAEADLGSPGSAPLDEPRS